MSLQIYNTLTRTKEVFKPKNQENVKVYFCGPTPYNYAHIGNLKTYVFEDVVIRSLRFLGYKVTSTMNITDIEDKTIRECQKSGEDLLTFTRKYTKVFFEDLEKLSVIKADNVMPITELISEMVDIINGLLKKGFAYVSDDGSIYYSIKKFATYGQLALLDMSGMKSSVRINNDEYEKDNVGDFVLWKAYDEKRDGKNFWEGDFVIPSSGDKVEGSQKQRDSSQRSEGQTIKIKGRPGWHIECSACNLKFFGPEIDLHMGAIDLIFPHHQNEIAQTEANTGKAFSRYWMHGGHLTVNGKKMSKSLNNFYTLGDIEKHFEKIPKNLLFRAIRLSFIAGKYRDTLDFSFEKLEQQINTIKGIDETIKKLLNATKTAGDQKVGRDFRNSLQKYIGDFVENLEDDINTPECLGVFFDFQTFVNTYLSSGNLNKSELSAILDMLKTFNQIFAIMDFTLGESDVPDEITAKLEARNTAKKDKDFTTADAIRDELLALGYKIIDDRSGVRLEKI